MKKSTKIILAITTAAAITGCIMYVVRRHNTNRKSVRVAHEGYETAHDILFPKKSRKKRTRLQHGR